jgi:glutamate synthase (ferredoxin)
MNKDMASLYELTEKYDIAELKSILEDYEKETNSEFAKEILDNFEAYIPDFKKIVPNDYQKMITAIGKFEEQGIDHEHAVLEAFKELA